MKSRAKNSQRSLRTQPASRRRGEREQHDGGDRSVRCGQDHARDPVHPARLQEGQEGVFVSLDENKEQIIREAVEMGWSDILEYLDDELLVFIDASGREFSNFIRKELPAFVADWKGSTARIVVDPLTPVLWSTKDLYEQRDLIGYMFKQTRKVGTVLCTLEEHGPADLSGPETVIPMYLADCVVHLKFNTNDTDPSRLLKILKCRNSRHSPVSHPFQIVRGLGIVI